MDKKSPGYPEKNPESRGIRIKNFGDFSGFSNPHPESRDFSGYCTQDFFLGFHMAIPIPETLGFSGFCTQDFLGFSIPDPDPRDFRDFELRIFLGVSYPDSALGIFSGFSNPDPRDLGIFRLSQN